MEFTTFDSGYLEKLAAGDAAVEDHFHRYFGELIWIKLRARQYTRQSIEDIRQETFLRVFQALRRNGIRQPERIGAFVNSVCNNVILEFHRTDSRTTAMEDPPDTPDPGLDSERTLIDGERRLRVREILARMPSRNRRLLTSIFLDERPVEEVCTEFGIDRNYLRVLLFRARTQLRQELRKSDKKKLAVNSTT